MKSLFYLLLGCLFSGLTLNLSAKDNLIPRSIFFESKQRGSFKLSSNAGILYFQEGESKNIQYCHTSTPKTIKQISMPSSYTAWEAYENGLLVIKKDSLGGIAFVQTDGSEKKYDLGIPAKNIRFLTNGPARYFAIEITCSKPSESGIYRFDPLSEGLTYLAPLQPHKMLYFDKDIRHIIAATFTGEEGNSILAYNSNKSSWDTISNGGNTEDVLLGGFTKVISVAADGSTIYYTDNSLTDKSILYSYNIATKKKEVLAQHSEVDLLPFGTCIDTGGKPISVVGLLARTERVIVNKNYKPDFDFLTSHIMGDLSFITQSLDGNKWLVREFCGGWAKYYIYDRRIKKLDYLLADVPTYENYTMAKRKAFRVKTRDGLNLPVHVYLPEGMDKDGNGIPDKPLPAILYVHGGPWAGVTFWNSPFHCRNFQLLANRGYAVVVCEFRGSTGLGKDFVERAYKKWGTDMTNDKTDIALWAVASGIARKDKIGIWGWSYGGYAAMAGLAFSPETYACGIAMYGISDLESFGRTNFANNDFWKQRVGDPFNPPEAKMLHDFSPINYVKNIKAPLLLTTGLKDDRIPRQQMDTMATALHDLNKSVAYFTYPDEGHDYMKAESWESFWAIAEKFLSEHLGGKYEPAGDDLKKGNYVIETGKEYDIFKE